MQQIRINLILAIFCLFLSTSAFATLIGTTPGIFHDLTSTGVCDSSDFPVSSAGVECRINDEAGNDYVLIDIGLSDNPLFPDARIAIDFIDGDGDLNFKWSEPDVGEIAFEDLFWLIGGELLGTIDDIDTTVGIFGLQDGGGTVEVVSGDNEITLGHVERTEPGGAVSNGILSIGECDTDLCARVTIDILASHPPPPPVITPEPTTLALVGLGLAGLGLRRKKVA